MVPVIESVVLPNQVKLPYAEQGVPPGVPVLFLHAIADSWRTFEPVLPYLPESICAIVPTQRGHGDPSHPELGYRPRDFVEDLTAFMDAFHLEAAVIGVVRVVASLPGASQEVLSVSGERSRHHKQQYRR